MDEKRPPETPGEAKPAKRKMKSPYQLEVLEKTYAVETYPSEALRAELSAKIGLTDRQLQMWFCHRRLKDRKGGPPSAGRQRQRDEDEDDDPPSSLPQQMPLPPLPPPPQQQLALVAAAPTAYVPRKASAGRVAVPRITGEAAGKRYYDAPMLVAHPPPTAVAELRVIAAVEAQLGGALREDGPILGVVFDPLPPGAFGAPIETDTPALSTHVHAKARQSMDRLECTSLPGQQKQSVRSYDGKTFERHEAKLNKASALLPSMELSSVQNSSSGRRKPAGGGALVVHSQAASRAVHEYQFLPEQPSIRSEPYERPSNPHLYDSSMVAPTSRLPPLPSGAQVLHGNEQVAPSYTFQGQISSAGLLSQHGRHQIISSASAEYDGVPHNNSNTNAANDAQFGVHQVSGSENPFMSSERRISGEEDTSRIERKRKSDEARIAKEVEAHEKRIRRELEKQDILRRKREEQIRKEMQRHDRERKKEEERMLRERQREEERFHREQRRELERREKFLQKETRRAEKLRQKEELRRAKEEARLKAANERATARRIAKESMELIEDERLELMELAVSSKGLSSIISLDSDTLQQLDSFRDMLSTFPTEAVRLKRPFQIQPWTNSEENIGNLLMVWKFLTTFADVFGLWPLTLDEFVQSLHDYDSRLLGEIHVAILKSIIKDIEDVARTPAVALGVNQNSSANPGGGHPQIVEGAYTWGFDIRCWQRHLNPLTWPEILRQFALSAGFGPQLKKRTVEHTNFRDENEGNDGDDVISILRNGAAAENAVALMQERGYPHRRRSRHRLTPGTVKFAAFHVLSLEGSNGLTILEVADKIQKSGLRDLTTSKTPEASIAAALSRDTKLFERTAPSTYAVRSPYRKDPANADTVLSAAREKIQVFASGLSDSEEIEKDVEDADDAERDEDSDCDVADDTEVDDTTAGAKLTKHIPQANAASLENRGGDAFSDKAMPTPPNGLMKVEKVFSIPLSGNSKGMHVSSALQSLDMCSNNHEADIDGTEIDESNLGEPWVQGLTEGEYSDLSVEERLNALVALIGVAIEGNSIRVILEERLEAATALKKQMWAEAQLDKRRLKEDFVGKMPHSTFSGYKGETSQLNPAAEGNLTSLHIVDNKGDDENTHTLNNDQFLDPHCQGNTEHACAERTFLGQDCSANPDAVPLQQHGYAAERSRSQLKSYIGHRAEELYVYRSLPLGQDRRRNRYWMFSTSSSRNDPGSGRIFFESRDGFWRLIDSEEAFDSLVAALDTRGVRESHLHSMLQRIETTFKETIRRQLSNSMDTTGGLINIGATIMSSSSERSTKLDSPSSLSCGLTTDMMEYSSSFKIELGLNDVERKATLKRYNCFMRWMWKECHNPFILHAMMYGKKRCSEMLQICQLCYQSYFAEERHCPSCHKTFKSFHYTDIHFNEHVGQCEEKRKTNPDWKIQPLDSTVPIGIRIVKAQLSLIEASIPADALQSFWTESYRKSWGVKLQSSFLAEDLWQVLSLLEGAIKRDRLSSNFETISELLASASGPSAGNTTIIGAVQVLPWVPDTTASLALRLLDLDASISYIVDEAEKERERGGFIKLPSRYPVVKIIQEPEQADNPHQVVEYMYEQRWLDPGSGRRGRGRVGRGRGGRGRGRGGRGTRGLGISTRTEYMEGTLNYEKTTRKYTRRGRARGRGRGRGRRTVRPRQLPELSSTFDKEAHFGNFNDMGSRARHDSADSSPQSSGGEEWHLEEEMRMPYVDEDDISAGSHSDEMGEASGEEYDDQIEEYGRDYVSKPTGAIGNESEEEDDSIGDEVEDDRDRERHEFLDADMDDDYEEIGDDSMDIEEGDGNRDEDGTSAFSSDFSE